MAEDDLTNDSPTKTWAETNPTSMADHPLSSRQAFRWAAGLITGLMALGFYSASENCSALEQQSTHYLKSLNSLAALDKKEPTLLMPRAIHGLQLSTEQDIVQDQKDQILYDKASIVFGIAAMVAIAPRNNRQFPKSDPAPR